MSKCVLNCVIYLIATFLFKLAIFITKKNLHFERMNNERNIL